MAGWKVVLIDLTLEAESGVRVGGARADHLGTDSPILRDPRTDRPLLPGSSLKGVLRSAAERMLADRTDSNGRKLACDIIADPCGGQPGATDRTGNTAGNGNTARNGNATTDLSEKLASLCMVCKLFGSHWAAGRIRVGDLVADDTPAQEGQTVVRDGVAIDRNELRAKDRLKYDYEVAVPGTRFTGKLRVDDPEPGDLGLVASLLDLVDYGVVTIGGGASRGLGRFTRAHLTAGRLDAATWQPGTDPDPVDLDAERASLRELLDGAPA